MSRKFLNGITDMLLGGVEHYEAALAADVSLTTTGTWYNGPSMSLPSGTWLLIGYVTQVRSATTAETIYARISDGTSHFASAQGYHPSASGSGVQMSMADVAVLAATTTVKLQATSSAGASTSVMKAAMAANGSGNNATKLIAVRLNAANDAVKGFVQLTQAQYNALGTPDPQTMYIIIG